MLEAFSVLRVLQLLNWLIGRDWHQLQYTDDELLVFKGFFRWSGRCRCVTCILVKIAATHNLPYRSFSHFVFLSIELPDILLEDLLLPKIE